MRCPSKTREKNDTKKLDRLVANFDPQRISFSEERQNATAEIRPTTRTIEKSNDERGVNEVDPFGK
eukprot:scaffold4976_cov161-Amphora_coffeaeformis.AAC.27